MLSTGRRVLKRSYHGVVTTPRAMMPRLILVHWPSSRLGFLALTYAAFVDFTRELSLLKSPSKHCYFFIIRSIQDERFGGISPLYGPPFPPVRDEEVLRPTPDKEKRHTMPTPLHDQLYGSTTPITCRMGLWRAVSTWSSLI